MSDKVYELGEDIPYDETKSANHGISQKWLHGVEDVDSFRDQIKSNTRIWKQLHRILNSKYRSACNQPINFDTPNYRERLIYWEGYKKALRDINSLLPNKD